MLKNLILETNTRETRVVKFLRKATSSSGEGNKDAASSTLSNSGVCSDRELKFILFATAYE